MQKTPGSKKQPFPQTVNFHIVLMNKCKVPDITNWYNHQQKRKKSKKEPEECFNDKESQWKQHKWWMV